MDNSKSFVNNLLQTGQVVLSLVPIPGLSACAIIVQQIYNQVQAIQFRKAECISLCELIASIICIINESYQPAQQGSFDKAVEALTNEAQKIKDDVEKWKRWNKAILLIRNGDIIDDLQTHRAKVNECLTLFHFSAVLEQRQYNVKALEARELDVEAREKDNLQIAEYFKLQDEFREKYIETKEMMEATTIPQQQIMLEENIIKMRDAKKSTGILPPELMNGEVTNFSRRPIHQGSRFDVYKAVWANHHWVAVSSFRGTEPRPKDMARLKRQVDIWRTLQHTNVLKLYGICNLDGATDGPFCFVSPWMKNRDIRKYLKNTPDADRLKLVYDTAKGLEYLHTMSVLHGNLQPSNILITRGGDAVLSDFSLAKSLETGSATYTQSNGPSGSFRYMPPENSAERLLTTHSDIYSWGMTALEILTDLLPFHTHKSAGPVILAVQAGMRPAREDYDDEGLFPDALWDLLYSCWDAPTKRPSIEHILDVLAAERERLTDWRRSSDRTRKLDLEDDWPSAF